MRVLITGGAGFLGQRLVSALLERGRLVDRRGALAEIDEILLFDDTAEIPAEDPRVRAVHGSVCVDDDLRAAIDEDVDSVFHLAAVVSGEAEADFDKGMAVNLGGSLNVLDACRGLGHAPRFVFASSVAAFGGDLPDTVSDQTPATPQSSYGTQKVIGELLVNDYSRKGFIDGRAIRLPTICVRPGAPNKAASGFASSMVREPLKGESATCPVAPGLRMWLMSPPTAIANLVHAHELPPAAFGNQRALSLEGLTVSAGEMLASLRRVCGDAVADRVLWERDPEVEAVVGTWPGQFDSARARSLGFKTDADFEAIIRHHLRESGLC
ncbi:MAG: D-erythronate dehydrogenase [Gammaproteobacteria bacterium]|nr:D-erythronate dehydrogenase [Gammaproteobacteria bacterium]